MVEQPFIPYFTFILKLPINSQRFDLHFIAEKCPFNQFEGV